MSDAMVKLSRDLSLPIDLVTEAIAVLGRRGKGKSLDLNTPLTTPTGWTTMGDIKVGDVLFDDRGDPCTVTAVMPVYDDHECFRVGFSDGAAIVADADHLWLTEDRGSRSYHFNRRRKGSVEVGREGRPQCMRKNFPMVRTTVEIRDTLTHGARGDLNHSIDNTAPLNLPEIDLPIHPYVLGAWLGDGASMAATITVAESDSETLEHIRSLGYVIGRNYSKDRSKTPTYPIQGGPDGLTLRYHLRTLGILGKNSIPAAYRRGSIDQRLELLSGLMDTDGWVEASGDCHFGSTKEWITDLVHELAVSLGWMVRRSEKPVKWQGAETGVFYLARFRPNRPPFHLARKASKVRSDVTQSSRHRHRMVKSVEPVPSVPVRCIAVDSPSNLFLAGRDLVPTHNTNTAGVIVEEVVGHGVPVCVVDTVGVWWGLRSSKTGKGAGLPIVVFGGTHGDLPLEETSGKIIAQVIVERRISAVIDTSQLSKAAARRFLTDFLVAVYHRNRDPFLFVFDEADELAPQNPRAEGARLLGAMEDFVRRGRARGLGAFLVTQRPAVLNKDVLTQIEVLIAHGLTGPRDVAAINEWVRLHADEEQASQVKGTLASLPVGTAWVWSPSWLGILQKVEVLSRKTFDSSATPKVGVTTALPQARAKIDLAELGDAIAATIERAAGDDPRHLRERIAQLERELAAAKAHVEVKIQEVPVEVPVPGLTVEDRLRLADATSQISDIYDLLASLQYTVNGIGNASASKPPSPAPAPRRNASPAPADPVAATPPSSPTPAPVRRPARSAPTSAAAGLGKAERAILAVLATYGPRTRSQVALQSGYSSKGGGFNNALGRLRSTGRIVGGRDRIQITEQGATDLGDFDPLPTGPALVDHWLSSLGKAERSILTVLVDAWPAALTNEEIAERTQYSAVGGGFNNALGKLRTLELIHGNRTANTAAEELGAAAHGTHHG
jgi:hypothetical protein